MKSGQDEVSISFDRQEYAQDQKTVLVVLGHSLRKLYEPLMREDVTARLRSTIERLEAGERSRSGRG